MADGWRDDERVLRLGAVTASPPIGQAPKTVVHRPAPYVIVYGAMVFLGAVTLPAVVMQPAKAVSGGGVFGLLVLLAFELLLWAIARRRVVLMAYPPFTTLSLHDARWPFRPRTREVPIAEIQDVTLQRARRSAAVRLVLTLRSGEPMPITQSFYGDAGHMERDAAAIRALCGLD